MSKQAKTEKGKTIEIIDQNKQKKTIHVELTNDHQASSLGLPIMLIDGQVVDPNDQKFTIENAVNEEVITLNAYQLAQHLSFEPELVAAFNKRSQIVDSRKRDPRRDGSQLVIDNNAAPHQPNTAHTISDQKVNPNGTN